MEPAHLVFPANVGFGTMVRLPGGLGEGRAPLPAPQNCQLDEAGVCQTEVSLVAKELLNGPHCVHQWHLHGTSIDSIKTVTATLLVDPD